MQRDATKLKLDAVEQLSLLQQHKVPSRPVSFDRIFTLTDTRDALEYACELARVAPKQIFGPMDIDKTVWSRICSGEWDLDGRDIQKLSNVVGNDAYLMYLNHIHGYDLHAMRRTMDDKDRRIFELEQKVAEQARTIKVAADLISGKIPQ